MTNMHAASDFNQWLHAMKMVAHLPGGIPPEFRKKLWLALAQRYLQTKNGKWETQEEKCFSEEWGEDDEELGTQIVKDLHRTGSSLCSGPAGTLNQAKLKRILLGYARWNPEVGYCQGFNMLGALMLQVMDKNEIESLKVMIYLVEGVLPSGYFSGSLGGLQTDMAVFRELMSSRLPALAKHLQKLQGPLGEGAFEPPLTNVFTMQWFLTLFCTCLPINCVLRVWDLVLIEGSEILLRTALSIWSLLEEKILSTKTADDFYCKMGTLSAELLNGHLIDSNGLIEKVVQQSAIPDLQKLREKHLYSIPPMRDKKGIRLFYSDDDGDSDDDSRLAVTTAWGNHMNRRSSAGCSKLTSENKERLALDISILKKQYDRLRERQRQAHIILTSAVARQSVNTTSTPSMQINQFLLGRNAIVTNRSRRIGPPKDTVPPARKKTEIKPSVKPVLIQSKRGETLDWRDTEEVKRRTTGIKWKDVSCPNNSNTTNQSDNNQTIQSASSTKLKYSTEIVHQSRIRKQSESSSFSEDSDVNSSSSTSLCDDDDIDNKDFSCSSLESSPLRKQKSLDNDESDDTNKTETSKVSLSDRSISDILLEDKILEIPSVEIFSIDEEETSNKTSPLETDCEPPTIEYSKPIMYTFPEILECQPSPEKETLPDTISLLDFKELVAPPASATDIIVTTSEKEVDNLDVSNAYFPITSTSQLSPIADISQYLSSSSISPLKTPSTHFHYTDLIGDKNKHEKNQGSDFDITEEGVTNEYFERINIVERPNRLDLFYSLNDSNISDTCSTIHSNNSLVKENSAIQSQDSSDVRMFELPSEKHVVDKQYQTPLISTEQSTISNIVSDTVADNSLLGHKEIEVNLNVLNTPESISSCSLGSICSSDVVKENSLFFDDRSKTDKGAVRPTSCPEARASLPKCENHSDRVLKIIEENSMILHRILRKNVPDIIPSERKENLHNLLTSFSSSKKIPSNENILKTDSTETKLEDKATTVFISQDLVKLDSQIKLPVTNTAISEKALKCAEQNIISFRSDDNIADRLASIKNSIKSIDTLCDDQGSYRKSKLQRYMDSLFDPGNSKFFFPSIQVSQHIDRNTENLALDTTTSNSLYLSRPRYSRDIKRNISPRRRDDEYREETESRSRIEHVPNYLEELIKSPSDCNIDDNRKESNVSIMSDTIQSTLSDEYNSNYKIMDVQSNTSTCCNKDTTDDCGIDSEKKTYTDDEHGASSNYVPSKIEIRHTTVTSTFYDRFLSQKRERDTKVSSPSSPLITKSYLNSLKPTNITIDRIAKSAENSPSRQKSENNLICIPTSYKTTFTDTQSSNDFHIHSCDNILLKLKTSPGYDNKNIVKISTSPTFTSDTKYTIKDCKSFSETFPPS